MFHVPRKLITVTDSSLQQICHDGKTQPLTIANIIYVSWITMTVLRCHGHLSNGIRIYCTSELLLYTLNPQNHAIAALWYVISPDLIPCPVCKNQVDDTNSQLACREPCCPCSAPFPSERRETIQHRSNVCCIVPTHLVLLVPTHLSLTLIDPYRLHFNKLHLYPLSPCHKSSLITHQANLWSSRVTGSRNWSPEVLCHS